MVVTGGGDVRWQVPDVLDDGARLVALTLGAWLDVSHLVDLAPFTALGKCRPGRAVSEAAHRVELRRDDEISR
jgi:hypothetical protein